MESRSLSMDELNKMALEHFVYQPVGRDMISYLADAASNVITCDTTMMPPSSSSSSSSSSRQRNMPPTPPRSPDEPYARAAPEDDDGLPTLEEFITQLVVSSNVQVPTLMSTLVYLTRLKSKLQPMARGLRCTTHRIFLACLILAAKYLNDSSPKNKHWANYSHMSSSSPSAAQTTTSPSFGFSRTEVNLMEKQLLFLLEWDLRITEEDLYRELDFFLGPLRLKIAERHARKMRHREEKRRQQELYAAAAAVSPRHPTPPASRGHSRSRQTLAPALEQQLLPPPQHARSVSAGSVTPPGLTYSSSGSSYTPSIASTRSCSSSSRSRHHSRSATPSTEPTTVTSSQGVPSQHTHDHVGSLTSAAHGSFYDSPVEIVLEEQAPLPKAYYRSGHLHNQHHHPSALPYEISLDQYHQMQAQDGGVAKKRVRRGMWGRLLGGAVAVR